VDHAVPPETVTDRRAEPGAQRRDFAARLAGAYRAYQSPAIDWTHVRTVAERAVQYLQQELPGARVSVHRIDPVNGTTAVIGSTRAPDAGGRREPTAACRARRQATVSRTIRTGEPQHCRAPGFEPGGCADCVVVPVLMSTGPWGLLEIERDAPALSAEDTLLVQAIAAQMAIGLEAARPGHAAQPEIDRLHERIGAVSKVCSLAEHFVRASDLSVVLQRVAEGAAELMDCEISSVLLLRQDDSDMLEIVASTGTAAAVAGSLIPIDNSMSGWVVRHGIHRMKMDYEDPGDAYRATCSRAGIRNTLIVPLRTDEDIVGVVSVSNRRAPGPYTADDVQLLNSLAAQAAAAIEASRLMDELKRRLAESTAMGHVGRAVTGTLALDEVLSLVVREADALIAAEGAAVALREDDATLRIGAVTRPLCGPANSTLPIEGSLMGWAVQTGETVVSDAISDDPRVSPHRERYGPGVVVPLSTRSGVLGSLIVARAEGAQRLQPADVEAIQNLASYAAIAIENAQLHAQTAALLDDMRAQLGLLKALLETGNRLRMELDLPRLLEEICEAIRRALGWRLVYLSVRDRRGSPLHALAGYDEAASAEILGRTPTSLETLQQLFQEEYRISNSYFIGCRHADATRRNSQFIVFEQSEQCDDTHWNSDDALLVPIVLRGELLGYISPDSPADGRKPTLETVRALELFANQAAVAIDNARLYQEQRVRTAELERANEELLQSQERLLVSEKMAALGRVTAGIAHEINSPLGGILNALQMATSYSREYEQSIGDAEVTEQDHRAIVKDLDEALLLAENATRKVAQFVRTIKEQTRANAAGADQWFDPAVQVEQTLSLLGHEMKQRRITLKSELAAGLRLFGDPTKFLLIVQNLLGNAADAYEERPGTVWIRCRADAAADAGDASDSGDADAEARIVLEVEDRGCGIGDEVRGRIFDYLFTTKEVGKGTGLGLSIVHTITTTHFGGRIELQTRPGEGSLFRVSFPAPPQLPY
jgi:GAF domain-containing protein